MPKAKDSGFKEQTNNERKDKERERKYKDFNNDGYGAEDKYFDAEVKRWLSEMDYDDRLAVETYTGWKYEDINPYLREGRYGSGDDPDMERLIDNATRGLNQFVLSENMHVYRKSDDDLFHDIDVHLGHGANSVREFVDQINASKGSVVSDKGFTSTSTRSSTWSGRVHFEIMVPKGTKCAYVDSISRNHGERELLLNRGTNFKIVSAHIKKGEGFWSSDTPVVVLQVVKPSGRKKS